jgi:CheY-like chemotaxis protein
MESDPVVLVVDDDSDVRESIIHALEMDGMTVVDAAGGEEALRILQCDRSISVMLTDIMMPGITGVTLAERVAEVRPDVRILLMTAYAPSDLMQGAVSVMIKPFRIAVLRARIRSLCGFAAEP